MAFFRKALAITGYTSLGASAAYYTWTRKCQLSDLSPSDYILHSTLYARHNPNNAPVTQDICIRRVPLSKIRPDLLETEGKLVEAFCAGVWSGLGFAYQRRYLEKKYRGPETADNIWDTKDLQSNTYEVGTRIVDHFEVLSKTPTSIIVRCGDSPRVRDARESDGLFELVAEIKEKEGVAEFGLKSVFYNALAKADENGKPPQPPMSTTIQWLHMQYDKILMETSLYNVKRSTRQ